MSFPLAQVIGTTQSRTNFIVSSPTRNSGILSTGGAGRMGVSRVVPASVTLLILKKHPPPQSEEC